MKIFTIRFAGAALLTLFFFTSCATALRAQTIVIKLVNGRTGRPVTYSSFLSLRTNLYVLVGHERKFPFGIPTDKHGVASLRLTHNDSEINVPECKGEDSDFAKMNKKNKKEVAEFNKKYKGCTMAFEVNNPIVRFADSISIGPVIRTLNGTDYFRYVPCWADSDAVVSTEKVLQHGVVTANNCGKATESPKPGQLILFVRPPTNGEFWRQIWNY